MSFTSTFSAITFLTLGGLGFGVLLKKLLQWQFKLSYISDYLPFDSILEDGKTIHCKDGTFVQFIRIQGPNQGASGADDEESIFQKKKNYFEAMASLGSPFRLFTRKKHQEVPLDGSSLSPVMQEIHRRWEDQFLSWQDIEHTLILQGASRKILEDNVAATLDYLDYFKPVILTQRSNPSDSGSSPLSSFLGEMVNIRPDALPAFGREVSEKISASDIQFDLKSGFIRITQDQEKRIWSVHSLKSFGDKISPEVFQDLYKLPMDFELMHFFQGMGKYQATTLLKYRSRQENIFYKNAFKTAQFEQAIGEIDGSKDAFYEYQGLVFLKATDEETLTAYGEILRRVCIQYGMRMIQECAAIEWYWFSRFPTYDKALRPRNVFARNLSFLFNFEPSSCGEERSDWGQGALRHFWTWDRQKYALQVHVGPEDESLAHTLTVAPSHGGKTTFFQHIIGGALRHKELHGYIFDRFCGTEVFTRSVGGTYIKFDGNLSLNPLLCDPTPDNIMFLRHFLRRLGSVAQDDPGEDIERFLNLLFEVPPQDRSLAKLYKSAFPANSVLRSHMATWAQGANSRLINGVKDDLDLHSSQLVSFDMTSLPGDSGVMEPMVDYILNRIRSQVRQHNFPHMIFIDEAAPLLQDSHFCAHVQVLLREHRKLRGSVNLCFQDAQSIAQSGIRDTLLNQCPTVFLFPNPKARQQDYEMFNLTEYDWNFIKSTQKRFSSLSRGVLIKRPESSVVVDANLLALGDFLYLYKSGLSFQKLMQKMVKDHGDHNWVGPYLEACSQGKIS